MRSILAALLAAVCGVSGCARPVCESSSGPPKLVDQPLAHGGYVGTALRRRGGPDSQVASRWTLSVDRAAGEVHIAGPGVATTRQLESLPRSAHKLDCFSGSDGLRLESFRIGAALQVGGLSLEEPLLVATCPGAGALLTDQRSGSDWKSAGLFFEPAP